MIKIKTTVLFLKRTAIVLFAIILAAGFLLPAVSAVENKGKTVRVGWYESPFNTTDKQGRRSGYAYEYQRKIAAYTGWDYEYVEGSWPELMEMLIRGEIDLMSDVSYTEERAGKMLFPALSMGTEEYFIFVAPDNKVDYSNNYSLFNGKKIGVNKGSVQKDQFLTWEKKNGINATVVELTSTEYDSVKMLEKGELDALVSLDIYGYLDTLMPICKVGASDYYFAVNKDRGDILKELESALSKIQDENRYYNAELYEKHVKISSANMYLTNDEKDWLYEHGTIRVGYQDNYLAFCAYDKKTQHLTGALLEYLNYASKALRNAQLNFKAEAYSTIDEAIEALKCGEIDCVFPANFTDYNSEELGVTMTPPIMSSEMLAVVRASDQQSFIIKKNVKVAVNRGNTNYDMFLKDNFPNWESVYFGDSNECLRAVADREADCIIVSNYRLNDISKACDEYRLKTVETGVVIDYGFAINKDESKLYSILAKAIGIVPSSKVSAALAYYSTEDVKFTFKDFLRENIGFAVAIIAIISTLIMGLLLHSTRAAKRASDDELLISATENDELTGLYNRNFFFVYADRLYQADPEKPMDAIVLIIERFQSVSTLSGRALADTMLRTLGDEISAIAEENEGIAGRFEIDRFAIYCDSLDNYNEIYDRLQSKLDDIVPNINIMLRMGVMPWQEGLEPMQLFENARAACSIARVNYNKHLFLFNDDVRNREEFDHRLINDLRRAVNDNEFTVHYQPKYDITSKTPKLVSAEALVRWEHHELGMISPIEFIPLFEKNGQIGQIDKYVWAKAAKQVALWRDKYGVVIPVSVNLSRIDIFDPELIKNLDKIVEDNGLDYSDLRLEVTETAYTENADEVIRVVGKLQQKGYCIEMDDFGSGYSSLNMLSNMPIDVLKMDREFIRNIENNPKDIRLVKLIIDIANNLKVPVIAEGVETKSQLDLLKELGCTIVQGYYFSRPLSVADFEKDIIEKTLNK